LGKSKEIIKDQNMKNTPILLFFTVILLASCNNILNPPKPITYIKGDNLTAQQLSFIPYQMYDTFSFSNSTGDSLKYTCVSRIESRYDRNPCSSSASTCWVYNDDQLVTLLTCKDTAFNFNLRLYQSGARFFANLYKKSPQDLIDQYMDINSSCGTNSGCMDSIVLNNKKYYNIAKLVNPSSQYYSLDTLYYSRQVGILRFCLADGEVWTKR
jgi:hypothetical protein